MGLLQIYASYGFERGERRIEAIRPEEWNSLDGFNPDGSSITAKAVAY
jgi:hypothetical protein